MIGIPRRYGRTSQVLGLALAAAGLGATGGNGASAAAPDAAYAAQRQAMVDAIAADVRATASWTGRAALDKRVMAAMRKVPRHRFVPARHADAAYDDQPLPIGAGQTISQPYIVALSTDLIAPQAHHVVLEIGTGSGYQAAVLAELVDRVCSVEIVEPLARAASATLRALGYDRVETKIGDGWQGWPERGPFDGIIVTAAAPEVPPALIDQLKPGAKMVIPVGPHFAEQELMLIEKLADGQVRQRSILPVRFVPLTGGERKP